MKKKSFITTFFDNNFPQKVRKPIYYGLGGLFILFIIFLVIVFSGLPPVEELENPKTFLASKVLDVNGEIVGTFFIEKRVEIKREAIPDNLVHALVATEDRKFYDHWGVDLNRFMKAMIKNIFFFSHEGASTVTQQLARNLYKLKSSDENRATEILRKVREWITAVQIERTYTKNEILELYFNISYFGRRAYGIESASLTYFNKHTKDLSVEESAMLVALLKSSVIYDPIRRPENALTRRNLVLSLMVDAGYLTESEYEQAKKKKIVIQKEKVMREKSNAPFFLEYIRQQMADLAQKKGLDLYRDGLTIYSSLDLRMQKIADSVVADHLRKSQVIFDKEWSWSGKDGVVSSIVERAIKSSNEYRDAKSDGDRSAIYDKLKHKRSFIDSVKTAEAMIETAFIVLDPKTGQIRVMIGGRESDFQYGLNHVTQIKRQPGSSFKPFVYTTAIDRGYSPEYSLLNQRFNYKGWSPQNAPPTYGGYLSLRQGLANSVNMVAARMTTSEIAPPEEVIQYAAKLGIKTQLQPYSSLALGAQEVSPLEMASAYSTLANLGQYIEPIAILKVENRDGITLEKYEPLKSQAVSAATAAIVVDMMKDVVNYGTGAGVRQYFQGVCAGKTGTTQDYADAWFVGFTPDLCGAVWVGFDDRRIRFSSAYGFGASAAMPIWAQFFQKTYSSIPFPKESFYIPADGVTTVAYCKESIERGDTKLAGPECAEVISDLVLTNHMPPKCNSVHTGPKIKSTKGSHNGGSGW